MLLDATSMGAIFTLLIPLALLTAEGKGLEYTKTLPITPKRIVVSKTLVTMATYIPVPFVLIALSLVKPLTSLSSILIPCLTIMSVMSASIFEIKLFLKTVAKSKIAGLVNDIEKMVIGALTVLTPIAAYSITFILSLNHALSLLAMGSIAGLELTLAIYLLKRS